MTAVTVANGEIHFDVLTDSDSTNPTVLWLHCFGGSGRIWHPLIADFPDRRHVTLDLRGHGRSASAAAQPGEAGVGLRRLAEDVLAVADHLGVPEFVVVGHSLGGGVGLRLAIDHPDRVAGVVSVSALPSSGLPRIADDGLAAYLRAMRDPGLQREVVTGGFVRPCAAPGTIEQLSEDGLVVHENFYLSWLRDGLAYGDFTDEARHITVPVDFMIGARDPNCPAAAQLEAAMAVPGARILWFEDEGHFWPWESSTRFVRELRASFEGLSTRRTSTTRTR